MNLKDKEKILKYIQEHEEKLKSDHEHEARMIMYRFLSEVERLMDEENINKKELARRIGTSSSYITQLFRGSKLVNLITLAKFQDALNFKFKIEGCKTFEDFGYNDDRFLRCIRELKNMDKHGLWVSRNENPEYDSGIVERAKDADLKIA